MLLLAAAAIATTAPVLPPRTLIEASARVRIVSGVRLKLDSPTNSGAPDAHDAKVTSDGQVKSARLIEFE